MTKEETNQACGVEYRKNILQCFSYSIHYEDLNVFIELFFYYSSFVLILCYLMIHGKAGI